MQDKTCKNCRFYHQLFSDHGVCSFTADDFDVFEPEFDATRDFVKACDKFQPRTNGDWLRSLNNEQLIEQMKNLHQLFLWDKYKALSWLNSPKDEEN
jgi:hypothetical protein